MTLLSVSNLCVSFRSVHATVRAVEDVGFSVKRGRTLGIVGESGSGKSVTCLALLGLLPTPPACIENGSAVFDGLELLHAPETALRRIRGRRIGMVFQDPLSSLNPYLCIGAQLVEPMRLHLGLGAAEARERGIAALAEVGIRDPARRFDDYPHELSGGMRQRVMIAMALAANPDLLIADEPTTALDVTIQAQILDLIRQLQERRDLAVVFISHNLGVIAGMADEILVMHAGRCVETGSAEQVLRQPQQAYTRRLLESIPATRKPTPPPANPAPLLSLQNVSVRHGRGTGSGEVVRGITLEVHRGEVLGLVGESGSGKSSLARAIVRLIEPSGGEISLAGTPITRLGDAQLRAMRPRMQMVFQDPYSSLDPRMTIHTCLDLALRQRGVLRGADRGREIERLMGQVELDPALSRRYPHEFSGGQRQRVAIARALALSPELLIADEPVSSLDVTVQAQILKLLLELNRRGLTMIFISHDLSVVRHLADRTAVMLDGCIIEINDTETLFDTPVHPYTRTLLSAIPVPHAELARRRRRIASIPDRTYPEGSALPPGSA